MSNETETTQTIEPAVRKLPAPREKAFIVQCINFRCMAYRDTRGKWRDYFNGDELPSDVTIIAEG